MEPESLRLKVFEPILLLGGNKFKDLNIWVRVNGGGPSNQIYAVRQAISKAILAYYQKYHDEQSKRELKEILLQYDKNLLITDPRRCEPKKFGGKGARSRFQKSYRWSGCFRFCAYSKANFSQINYRSYYVFKIYTYQLTKFCSYFHLNISKELVDIFIENLIVFCKLLKVSVRD